MSVPHRPSSRDEALASAFGTSIDQLYAQATDPTVSAALYRALELRSFLVVAEEQVARVIERVHNVTAPGGGLADLTADDLRTDAAWLEAALAGRDSYATALDELLRTMPTPERHPARSGQPRPPQLTTTARSAPSAVAPVGAGMARARRP